MFSTCGNFVDLLGAARFLMNRYACIPGCHSIDACLPSFAKLDLISGNHHPAVHGQRLPGDERASQNKA